jgi:hypothetical protein
MSNFPDRLNLPEHFRSAIAAYAQQFHATTFETEGNYIASPLGSWLVLAILAAAADFTGYPQEKEQVEKLLGLSFDEASEAVKIVLALDGMENGVGVWFKESYVSQKAPRVASWVNENLLTSASKGIPTQEWLDNWTSELTHDLINKFPLEVTEDLFFLVATVLYTRFNWAEPFELTTTEQGNVWDVKNLLTEDKASVTFYDTKDGLVAVHYKYSSEGQLVISAVAEKEIDELTLLAYAHAAGAGELSSQVYPIELAGRSSKIIEVEEVQAYHDSLSVVLPAWESENTLDLTDPALGFDAVYRTLSDGIPPSDIPSFDAKQSTAAKYGRIGFEGAAVTAFGLRAATGMPHLRSAVNIKVNFSQPYAVVCMIQRIPVFSGIIRVAVEPE